MRIRTSQRRRKRLSVLARETRKGSPDQGTKEGAGKGRQVSIKGGIERGEMNIESQIGIGEGNLPQKDIKGKTVRKEGEDLGRHRPDLLHHRGVIHQAALPVRQDEEVRAIAAEDVVQEVQAHHPCHLEALKSLNEKIRKLMIK